MRRWLALLLVGAALPLACARHPSPGPERLDAARLQQRIQARQGQPLLVAFWATWCKPCVEEIPELAALHRDRDAGVRVLAVSLDGFLSGDDRSPQVVREFLAGRAVPYEQVVYAGSQDALLSAFDLPGNIPYSILYDARGGVVQRFEGSVSARAVRAALGLASS